MTQSGLTRFISSIKGSLGIRLSSNDLSNKSFKLKVISAKFGVLKFEVSFDENGRFLKKKALELFSENANYSYFTTTGETTDSIVNKFRLIRVRTRQEVRDTENLKRMNIENNEEFLLNEHRSCVADPIENLDLRGPSQTEIQNRTANLKASPKIPPPFNVSDLMYLDDMRKVFVTLAQESAHLIGVSSHADSLIKYYRQRILNFIKNDKNAVKVMVQLGFQKERVEMAMLKSANNYKLALDWLIRNETPMNYDEVLFEDDNRRRSSNRTSLLINSARKSSILSSQFTPSKNSKDRIDDLLEIVSFFAKRDEIVYNDNIEDMVAMGFNSEISHNALRVTRNNIAAAIAFIEGEETPSIFELRDGLAAHFDIRKKMLQSPQILYSLGKPKIFNLYIEILNNPTNATMWNPFSEAGELMTHIIVKYHEEKLLIAAKQFNQSRLSISALSSPT